MGAALYIFECPKKQQSHFGKQSVFGGNNMFHSNLYVRIFAQATRYRVPMIVRQVYKDNEGFFNSLCPRCHRTMPWEYMSFCPGCGQRLSWIFLDEAEELILPLDFYGIHREAKLHFLCRSIMQRFSSSIKHMLGCKKDSIKPYCMQKRLRRRRVKGIIFIKDLRLLVKMLPYGCAPAF